MTTAAPETASEIAVAVQRRWRTVMGYRQRLVSLARSKGAGADAEDVAHHALLRAAEHLQLDERAPWPYLATIATNRLVDIHRRASRDLTLRHHAGLVPRQRSFEDDAENRTDLRRLLRSLSAMENTETVALVLRRADGLTWRELGEEFGRSESFVETRVRRAMLKLRRRLGQPGSGAVDRDRGPGGVGGAVRRRRGAARGERAAAVRPGW
jgi:RNA polymerase sigma factor (sigma-70 family)